MVQIYWTHVCPVHRLQAPVCDSTFLDFQQRCKLLLFVVHRVLLNVRAKLSNCEVDHVELHQLQSLENLPVSTHTVQHVFTTVDLRTVGRLEYK